MNEQTKFDIALMKFSILSPLISGLTDQYPSQRAFFIAMSEKGIERSDGTIWHVSVSTLQRWYFDYKKLGFDGLLPSDRNDLGISRVMDEDILKHIAYLKQNYPRMSATDIHNDLLNKGIITYKEVSLTTIRRYVRKIKDDMKITVNKDMRRYEQEHINVVWCGDSSVGPWFTNDEGKKVRLYIIALIDDASRFIVAANLFYEDNFVNLMAVIKSAIVTYGKPKLMNFDNGKPYRNKQMELLAARVGMTINYCEPYTPTSKSKIERWFRTMKDKWMATIDTRDFKSLDELRVNFSEWVNKYNQSPHTSLNNETPLDRFFSESEHIHRMSEEQIAKTFLLEVDRKVTADCVVKIEHKEYEVNYRYAKQRVKFRYSPDLNEVYVVNSDNTLVPIKLLDKHQNAHIKREKVHLSQGVQ